MFYVLKKKISNEQNILLLLCLDAQIVERAFSIPFGCLGAELFQFHSGVWSAELFRFHGDSWGLGTTVVIFELYLHALECVLYFTV